MPTKLHGTLERLQQLVEMTGASGEWHDKGRGQWQFRANDGAILNWWQSSGTLTFQGPETPRREFEQIFQLALRKLEADGSPASSPSPDAPAGPTPTLAPGRYRHYKGNDYQVLGVARHSETEEQLVVYRALYGEGGLWVRPLAMFLETVTLAGQQVPRFHRIED